MKIKDVKFKETNDHYIRRCVFDDVEWDEVYKRKLYAIIHKSSTEEEVVERYLTCEAFQNRQAYAVLAKEYKPSEMWMMLRKNLGDRVFKTTSDAGSVKVGSDAFSVLLPNGRGDGVTRCAIVDCGSWCSNFLTFFTSIQGDAINIYSYDCGSSVAKTIKGRYGVYYGDGFVVFEKWD